MATGLGASLVTLTAGGLARAEDVSANFSALNSASTFSFATCAVDPSLTPDQSFRGLKMISSTDFGLLNDTNNNYLRLQSGMTSASKVACYDRSNRFIIGWYTDYTYDYIVVNHGLRIVTGASDTGASGGNALRLSSSNSYNVGGSNYGLVTAANAIFNQGSGNADVAEPMLTSSAYGAISPGMAVCCIDHDIVALCNHDACKLAKIVSTAPTVLLSARVDDELEPLPGHESAMPIVIGGIAPVAIRPEDKATIKLRDRLTTSGVPGLLRIANEHEYAIGDVVKIAEGVIYAWIHY